MGNLVKAADEQYNAVDVKVTYRTSRNVANRTAPPTTANRR